MEPTTFKFIFLRVQLGQIQKILYSDFQYFIITFKYKLKINLFIFIQISFYFHILYFLNKQVTRSQNIYILLFTFIKKFFNFLYYDLLGNLCKNKNYY